jgi:hypothetical protein
MKVFRLLLVLAVPVLFCSLVQAGDIPKDLKDKLFARYNGKNMNVVHDRMLVALKHPELSARLAYRINYDYFDPAFTLPGAYQRRNLLDPRTTEEATREADFTDSLTIGEMVRVYKFYMETRGRDAMMIDFYINALDNKRVARMQTTYGQTNEIDFGLHFRFVFPVSIAANSDSYDSIVRVINNYFLPSDEYQQLRAAEVQSVEKTKNVEIQPGMSKEEVIKILGAPDKTVVFGKKTILKYRDMTVELENDKVVDVKT